MKKTESPDFSEHYHKKKIHDILFRWVDHKKISILKRLFDNKGYKILDYGCGTADITSQIEGCKIHGVDNNPKLLDLAERNHVIVKKGDFENIPYPSDYFDAVISIDTIEHVSSRNNAFREIKRTLKPNGMLVIFTPNYSSALWVWAEKTVNIITGRPSGHLSPFNTESLRYFMKQNFRKVSEIKKINFFLGLYVFGKNKK